MKKIRIHSEQVTKKGGKHQFQIQLPRTAKRITGLLITAIRKIQPQGILSNGYYAGWLRLRTPGKQDVFYADLVKFSNHEEQVITGIERLELGITDQDIWWFGGAKHEFFKIDIPSHSNMVEGYFEDHSANQGQPYTLKVYLEITD